MVSNSDILLHMEDSQEIFVAGIRELISLETEKMKKRGGKKITISAISDTINVSPSNLSGFLNFHRNYSEQKRINLAAFFEKTYMEVLDIGRAKIGIGTVQGTPPALTATEPPAPPQRRKTDLEVQADKQHERLVGRFVHKKIALQLNQVAIEIEDLEGETGLRIALDKLEELRDRIVKKKDLDQKNTGTESSSGKGSRGRP